MPPFIDSRFPKKDYNMMQTAVADTQRRRMQIMGPPPPGSPMNMSEGVEARATADLKMRQDQGPMQPMIVNGGMRFQGPTAPASATAPMMSATPQRAAPPASMMMPAPASLMGAPMSAPNALSRGAPAGMGSMMGGARPAGGRSANDPMRIAETARRRGDPSLIMGLAGQQQQQQFQREMFGMQQEASAQRDAINFGQGLQMFGAQQDAMNQRDAMNFGQQKEMFQMQNQQRAGESALEFQRRQEADAADRAGQSIVGGEQLPMMGGSVPMVKRADGTMSMAGGFIAAKPEAAPMTPDDIAAARAMGGDVSIQQGNTQIRFPGMAPDKPTRLTALPGAPSMVQGGQPTPDRVFDPYTGEFYEAGKVPGRGAPAKAATQSAPAAAPDPKTRMNALRKRLGLAEL